jgi:hypothetical protein
MGSAGAFLLRGMRTGLSEEALIMSNWPVQIEQQTKRSSATKLFRVGPPMRSFGRDHEALAVRRK